LDKQEVGIQFRGNAIKDSVDRESEDENPFGDFSILWIDVFMVL
jgi:hypothetical protein